MIRINLSGAPRNKKGKGGGGGGSVPSLPGDGPNIVPLLAGALLIGVLAFWFVLYAPTVKESKRIEQQTAEENAAITKLADVDKKFDQRQKEKDQFEKRVKVIDQLRADQSGPVNLLNTIGDTVNNTDAVWLNNMAEQGNTVNLDGVALSTNAIANLITNLKRSGYFKTVEIKDAVQDTAKDIQSFTFTLSCEKATAEKKS